MNRGILGLTLTAALVAGCGLETYGAENLPPVTPNPMDLVPPNTQRTPDLAPNRRIEEVDCSKPVDFSRGNLRCK